MNDLGDAKGKQSGAKTQPILNQTIIISEFVYLKVLTCALVTHVLVSKAYISCIRETEAGWLN